MSDWKRAVIADQFLEKFKGHEALLLRFVRLWEDHLNLDTLDGDLDLQSFKRWLAERQGGAWDEMVQNFCEVHELCTEIGHRCLLHVLRQARKPEGDLDGRVPVEELSLKTRIQWPELFQQAFDHHLFSKTEKFTVYLAPGIGAIRDPQGVAVRLAESLSEQCKLDGVKERLRVTHYREQGRDHFAIHHDKRRDAEFVIHSGEAQVVDAHLLRPAQVDLIIYHGAHGLLEIEAKYPKEQRGIRRLFAQACFDNPDLFQQTAKTGCFHLARLAEPDFSTTVDNPSTAYLAEVHFEARSASELDRDKTSFIVRGVDVLKTLDRFGMRASMEPGSIRRAVFRFQFADRENEQPVTIIGVNKIVFKHTAHQDEIYRYLLQWGVLA